MSMIDSIAGLSTAMSSAQLQNEVSTRVLKLAQGQDQAALDLLQAAMENAQEIVSSMAEGLGGGVDMTA